MFSFVRSIFSCQKQLLQSQSDYLNQCFHKLQNSPKKDEQSDKITQNLMSMQEKLLKNIQLLLQIEATQKQYQEKLTEKKEAIKEKKRIEKNKKIKRELEIQLELESPISQEDRKEQNNEKKEEDAKNWRKDFIQDLFF